MPTYVYRCGGCRARLEERYPMARVPERVACPECGADATRTISAPALGVGNSPAMRLQDHTRATADAPQTVTSIPRRRAGGTPVTTNPLHQRLPRP